MQKRNKRLFSAVVAAAMLLALLPGAGVRAAEVSPGVKLTIKDAQGVAMDASGAFEPGAAYTMEVAIGGPGGADTSHAYAVALPFVFKPNVIQVNDIACEDFAAKELEGVVVGNAGYTNTARGKKYDAYTITDEDYDTINADGKFLLSFVRESGAAAADPAKALIDLSAEAVYFKVTFEVKVNIIGAAGFAEYDKALGIDTDSVFFLNGGDGVLSHPVEADGYGAYYLAEPSNPALAAEYRPLNYFYENGIKQPPVGLKLDLNVTAPLALDSDGDGVYQSGVDDGADKLDDPDTVYVMDLNKTASSVDVSYAFDAEGDGAEAARDAGTDTAVYRVDVNGGTTLVSGVAAASGSPTDTDDGTVYTREGRYTFTPNATGLYKIVIYSVTDPTTVDTVIIRVLSNITIYGRALLTGKYRSAASGYTVPANRAKTVDANIEVQLYGPNGAVGQAVSTIEADMTAVLDDTAAAYDDIYNYALPVDSDVLQDKEFINGNYFIRFTRYSNEADASAIQYVNGGAGLRPETYLCAELRLTDYDAAALGLTGQVKLITPTYLYAGAFEQPGPRKSAIGAGDLNLIKALVGSDGANNPDYNINEYLGIDLADYSTVLRYVGKQKSAAGSAGLGGGDTGVAIVSRAAVSGTAQASGYAAGSIAANGVARVLSTYDSFAAGTDEITYASGLAAGSYPLIAVLSDGRIAALTFTVTP